MSRVSSGNFANSESLNQKDFDLDYFRSAEDSVYGSTTYLLRSSVVSDRRSDAFAAVFGDGPAQTGQVEILLNGKEEKSMHVNDIWDIIEKVEQIRVPEYDTSKHIGEITYCLGNQNDAIAVELRGHPGRPIADEIYRISDASDQESLEEYIRPVLREAYEDALN